MRPRGCGRTGDGGDGSWYWLTMSDLEHTTRLVLLAVLLMDRHAALRRRRLSHQDIAQLRAALTCAVQAIPRILTPSGRGGTRAAAFG